MASEEISTHRLWRIIAATALLLLLALAVAAVYVARHIEPVLRTRAVAMLSQRFGAPAQLDSLHISALDGLNVRGDGLRIANQQPDQPPLLQVKSFQFHISLTALRQKPLHVSVIRVQGMQLYMPPKGERGHLSITGNQKQKFTLQIDKILCDDATLTLATSKPGKPPRIFAISQLTLTHIVPGQAMQYTAQLVNPKPLGNIAVTGNFGPWSNANPRATPVNGDFSFTHADLSTIKGIGGMLSSTGKFSGPLDALTVDGTTDTPDFRIESGNHSLPLHTKYHATVDGTTGDVTLSPVEATLAQSSFTVHGTIMRQANVPGHDIALQVTMPHGRIDDMLRLAVHADQPALIGTLQMQAQIHIPPGDVSVVKKIQLAGNFNITGVTYSSTTTQSRMNSLSLRAQGRANELKTAANETAASNITGHFQMASGTIAISQMQYTMPGAQIDLAGTYSIDGGNFNFHGLLRTQAKISQMTTGFKSVLLRAVDPLFAKDGAGAQVPVKIYGTHSDMHFGLDFHDKNNPDKNNYNNANSSVQDVLPLW